MGFENRDYFQDDHSGGPSWGHDVPTTRWLLIVTVLVFVFQSLLTHEGGADGIAKFGTRRVSVVDEWFMLDASAVHAGQVWRVLSYAFCHDRSQALALVFNMIILWFVGSRLERMYGSREILLFYLGSSLLGGVVFATVGAFTPLPYPLSGASAGVLALFTLYATHFPREQILLFWLVPVEIWVVLLIYTGLDLYTVLQATQGDAGWPAAAIAVSHLSGNAFGYLYRHFDWHLSGLWERLNPSRWRTAMRRASTARKLRVYQPADKSEELEAKVDAILAKIHEHGSDSLTEAERSILSRASERYKNRS